MKRCVQITAGDARFCQIARVSDLPSDMGIPDGWIGVDKAISPLTHYWDRLSMAPVPYPPRPMGGCWCFDLTTCSWVLDESAAWALVRAERDRLLAACDWRVARAMEAGEPLPAPWAAYRQALRDITEQADPLAIDWPMPPA